MAEKGYVKRVYVAYNEDSQQELPTDPGIHVMDKDKEVGTMFALRETAGLGTLLKLRRAGFTIEHTYMAQASSVNSTSNESAEPSIYYAVNTSPSQNKLSQILEIEVLGKKGEVGTLLAVTGESRLKTLLQTRRAGFTLERISATRLKSPSKR